MHGKYYLIQKKEEDQNLTLDKRQMDKEFNHYLSQIKISNKEKMNKIKYLKDKEKFNKIIFQRKEQ